MHTRSVDVVCVYTSTVVLPTVYVVVSCFVFLYFCKIHILCFFLFLPTSETASLKRQHHQHQSARPKMSHTFPHFGNRSYLILGLSFS